MCHSARFLQFCWRTLANRLKISFIFGVVKGISFDHRGNVLLSLSPSSIKSWLLKWMINWKVVAVSVYSLLRHDDIVIFDEAESIRNRGVLCAASLEMFSVTFCKRNIPQPYVCSSRLVVQKPIRNIVIMGGVYEFGWILLLLPRNVHRMSTSYVMIPHWEVLVHSDIDLLL